jgi:hypothetical protein
LTVKSVHEEVIIVIAVIQVFSKLTTTSRYERRMRTYWISNRGQPKWVILKLGTNSPLLWKCCMLWNVYNAYFQFTISLNTGCFIPITF